MNNKGYTILEASTVLILVGLVGIGFLFGGDMVKKARLKNLVVEVQDFQSSIGSFRLKHRKYFPGDLPTATAYFSASTGNGDGNGVIDFDDGSGGAGASEVTRAWQHLSLSGLTSGSYSGLGTTPTEDVVAPAGGFAGSVYVITGFTSKNNTGTVALTDPVYTNAIRLGKPYNDPGNDTHAVVGLLTPSEVESIDRKFDDGFPGQGFVSGGVDVTAAGGLSGTSGGDCIDTGVTPNVYDLSKDDAKCTISFGIPDNI